MRMTHAALLLADPSPALRSLVLRDLLGRPSDDLEVQELTALREEDPLISSLLEAQAADGSWASGTAWFGHTPKLYTTSLALQRLGYVGLGPNHPGIRQGAEYILSRQRPDGSWPLPARGEMADEMPSSTASEGYSMVPLQTAIPLQGLAACGYAADMRAEQAYEWLLAQRLPDGAWPTGLAAGNYGYVAGYRRLAHSRWGCRSNTTAVLNCLAHHPQRRTGREAHRALDLLLGRETRETHTLGFEVARLVGAEQIRGFFTYHARFDLAFVLDLCWRVGVTDDPRVSDIAGVVASLFGPLGLWQYRARPQVSRWVIFDLLRSFSRLNAGGEGGDQWLSVEARTPFRPYPHAVRRY